MTSQDTQDLQVIESDFQSIKLKFGVNRKTDKFETVPDHLPKISLSMVESWTGKIMESGEDADSITSGLVKFKEGDVLFNKLRPYLAKTFVANSDGAGSPEFLVLRPTKFDARYLHYLLLSKEFIERVDTSTYGARMPRASWDFIGDIRVPYPDKCKQSEIASFLDYRTTQIDRLVNKMESLLNVLEEKKESTQLKVVTKGIDHQTTLKDSGVPWLGNIPENWEVRKLKWCVQEAVAGPYGSSLTKSMYTDTGPRVYGQQEVIANDFDVTGYRISEEKFSDMSRYQVYPGDILITVMGTIGEVAVVPPSAESGIINPRLVRYKIDDSVLLPEFVKVVLESDGAQAMLQQRSNGSTMEGLNMKILGNLRLPVPPISEQEEILKSIQQSSHTYERGIDMVNEGINLLNEHRRALITRTVTGYHEPVSGKHAEIKEQAT